MRILYGVVGEGLGHATRSSVILDHLCPRHEVQIVCSGKAHALLKSRFPAVTEIEGLRMALQGEGVHRGQTIWQLLKRAPDMLTHNFDQFVELSERFRPDVVISDFESFAYTFGKHHEVPVLSIDNMQIINRCALDLELNARDALDFRAAKAIVKSKLPGCDHYLITSFFFPPIRKDRTSLYPPVLRPEILEAPRRRGEHLLVYVKGSVDEHLLDILHATEIPCRVYGLGRDETFGNIQLCQVSEQTFIEDLASCRGVLTNGGFSLISEAICLHKPIIAVPLRNHFEQLLNALYVERLGYGVACRKLSAEAIRTFWRNLARHETALASYHQDGNMRILSALDRLLGTIAARHLPQH